MTAAGVSYLLQMWLRNKLTPSSYSDDREALLALARTLLAERNREKERAQQQAQQLEELQC